MDELKFLEVQLKGTAERFKKIAAKQDKSNYILKRVTKEVLEILVPPPIKKTGGN